MSERAWRNEGRMAGEASRAPVVRFTDDPSLNEVDEEKWGRQRWGDRQSWQYAYWSLRAELKAKGQPLFRKDVPEATARMMFVQRKAEERKCPVCGQGFQPRFGKHIFCSLECRRTSESVPVAEQTWREQVCSVCGSAFRAHNSRQVYCGEPCRRASWNETMRKRRDVA
jgi:ribosomal protein S27AE